MGPSLGCRSAGAPLEVEEVVERLAGAIDLRRRRFALDRRSGRIERAGIADVLWRYPCGQRRFHAFKAAARIEGGALRAAVQVGSAPHALRLEPDLHGDDRPALGTADHVAVTRHVDVAGAVLRDSAGPGRSAGFGSRPGLWLRLAVPIVVVVAPL